MARGFVYLTAVVDWATRKILAHRVAITLDAVEVLEEAFARYGLPDIVNTDRGSPVHGDRVHRGRAGPGHPAVDGP
jgi:transposase InsO family protein